MVLVDCSRNLHILVDVVRALSQTITQQAAFGVTAQASSTYVFTISLCLVIINKREIKLNGDAVFRRQITLSIIYFMFVANGKQLSAE